MILLLVKRKKLVLLFSCLTLLTLVVLFQPVPASACDCDIPDNATEALEKATAVFKGTVIMLQEKSIFGEKHNAALLSVSENWKGNEDSQVIVYTDWTSCQFDFEEGKEYLLYPYEYNGKLKVINCGRSAEITNAQEDLIELGAGSKPTNIVQLEDKFQKETSILIMSVWLLVITLVVVTIIVLRRKMR